MGWSYLPMFKTLWSYRYFIVSSVKTEFRSRFARSKLGGLWMILHPLAQVAIYTLVLSAVLSAKLPGIDNRYAYSIYLMSGMLGWTLFAEVLGRTVNIFVENGNLIQKLSFPRITLPMVVVGTALVNNMLLLAAIMVVFSLLGHLPSLVLLWVPILIALNLAMATGLGLFLAVLNVFIRDISQLMEIILQFWFWLTPIVYMANIIPDKYRSWFYLNPVTGVIEGLHRVMLYRQSPDLTLLIYPFVLSVFFLFFSFVFYRRSNEDMADAL